MGVALMRKLSRACAQLIVRFVTASHVVQRPAARSLNSILKDRARFSHSYPLKLNFIAHCRYVSLSEPFISNHISAEINSRESAAIIKSLLLIINPLCMLEYSV